MEKDNKTWTWHSPTSATLKVGKREIEITLSRPMDERDLPWLYQSVFDYKQLNLKSQTSTNEEDKQAA